ncbi:hypothetical protein Tco_0241667 [Tanacetum coccineum]
MRRNHADYVLRTLRLKIGIRIFRFWNDPRKHLPEPPQKPSKTRPKARSMISTGSRTICLARRGKQRGHIPGVGRVLPARATAGPSTPASESADDQEDEDEDGDGDS